MSKLLVVTGGTRGIGRAVVERFATAGFDVAVCARTMDSLQALKMHVETEYSTKVHIFQADLSDVAQVKTFTRFVMDLDRPVDALVNNSGLVVSGDLSTEPDGNIETMIDANLYSAYHLTRGLVPAMTTLRSGHIFNMCSIASFTAYPNGGSYAISKFALLGFSRWLREALKEHGIRVTSVMPGASYTQSWQASGLPEERFIHPEDVAEIIFCSYSLSPRSVVEDIVIRPLLGDIRD